MHFSFIDHDVSLLDYLFYALTMHMYRLATSLCSYSYIASKQNTLKY